MSTIVVTPPAAADAVARATPSPGALPVCTCASTWPGRIRCPAGTSIRSARPELAGRGQRGDAPVARRRSRRPRCARPASAKRPLTTRSSIAGVYARSRGRRHAVLQIDTEHPSAFGAGPARWRERLRRRLEAASGRPVEVVHYLDAARPRRRARDRALGLLGAVGGARPGRARRASARSSAQAGGRCSASARACSCSAASPAGGSSTRAEPEIGELEVDVVEPDGLLRGVGARPARVPATTSTS